jgi:hypothetical protein
MNVQRGIAMTTLAVTLGTLAPGPAVGEQAPSAATMPAPPPCTAPEHRQFDFWIGDWIVHDPSGKLVGENHITRLHNGCVLHENWTGRGGFTGSSLNAYDAERKKWHQTWVDGSGGVLTLDGEFADGRMTLDGRSAPDAQGVVTLQRITWTPLPDGRVRQLWQSSTDAGRTWTVAFDGYYSKVR